MFRNRIVDVISSCSEKQMIRAHAEPHVAFVQDKESAWDVSVGECPRYTMGAGVFTVKAQPTVTVFNVAAP